MTYFRLCHEPPALDQFWELFDLTGWNDEYHAEPADLERALKLSSLVICAYDDHDLAGFGRAVTDGSLHAMIYDLIVRPEYRCQGLGGRLLDNLVERCKAAGIRDIQLFCARGQRHFYERHGFAARPEEAPGMQYRWQTN